MIQIPFIFLSMACRNIPLSLLTWSFLTVSPSCVTNHVFGLELHAVVFFNSRKAVQQLSVLPSKIKVMILRKIASKMAVWVAWDKASSWANPIRNCKANPAKTMDAHQDVPWCLQNICTIVHKDVYLYTQSHIRVQLGSRPTSLQFPRNLHNPKRPCPTSAAYLDQRRPPSQVCLCRWRHRWEHQHRTPPRCVGAPHLQLMFSLKASRRP